MLKSAAIRENIRMRTLSSVVAICASVVCAAAQMPHGTTVAFTSGTSTEVPFRIVNNLILVQATVNGSGPGTFIFDTGAGSTVVDTAFARAVGLTQNGTTTGTGAAGTAKAGVMKNASVAIGGLRTTGLTVYSLPLESFTPTFAVRIDGIIGNDIIGRTVAEIDYANAKLTLTDPSTFKAPPHSEKLTLILADDLAFIKTTVTPHGGQPIPALMEIDTGSTGAVLLNSPYVTKHKLLATLTASVAKKTGGVGGTGTSRVGRISTLKFGSGDLKDPIAVLYTGTKGDNASSEYDGLIGGGIFRRFKLTVDLAGKALYIEPGPHVADKFDADMSGMELLADGADLKAILVDDVTKGSAAEQAGIRGGDHLQEVDGRSVREIGLEEVKLLFRQDGTSHDLTILRAGKVLHLHINLRRVI